MHNQRILLTAIAFLSYMVMAGLLTQAGVILNALAAQLALPSSTAVTLFSWLTGGALLGTFMAMYCYTRYSVRSVLVVTYSVFLVVITSLQGLPRREFWLLAGVFLLLGVCCGCGLSGGAVILSRIYQAQRRASAFIATDCSFSAAGYVFPSLAAWLLAHHYDWRLSYLCVGALALVILLLASRCELPRTSASPSTTATTHNLWAQLQQITTPRVLCFAAGVALYLVAQTAFLTWAPNYLLVNFGASQAAAGQVVANYWGLSIVGLLLSVVLVNVIPTRYMLIALSLVAVGFSLLFLQLQSINVFLTAGLLFGLTTTSIYKLGLSLGTQQVTTAPPMLVTFMLFSGSIGSTLAPTLSGYVVALSSERGALLLTFVSFLLMCVSFGLGLWLERRELKAYTKKPVK